MNNWRVPFTVLVEHKELEKAYAKLRVHCVECAICRDGINNVPTGVREIKVCDEGYKILFPRYA